MTQTSTPARPVFRHDHEHYTWRDWTWDIAELRRNIDNGAIRPKQIVLDRAFIEGYATSVLALDKDPAKCTRHSILMHVDVQSALALPAHAVEDAVIMVHSARKGSGILKLEGGTPDHILADGNHRLARAFFDDVPTLTAYVLSQAQSRKFRLD